MKLKAIIITFLISAILGVLMLVTPFTDKTAYFFISSPILLLVLIIFYDTILDKLNSKDDE